VRIDPVLKKDEAMQEKPIELQGPLRSIDVALHFDSGAFPDRDPPTPDGISCWSWQRRGLWIIAGQRVFKLHNPLARCNTSSCNIIVVRIKTFCSPINSVGDCDSVTV
jgi:hypothetical protein